MVKMRPEKMETSTTMRPFQVRSRLGKVQATSKGSTPPFTEQDTFKRTLQLVLAFLILLSFAYAEELVWPVSGTISSAPGVRIDPITGSAGSNHEGVDIPLASGTPVSAAGSGVVRVRNTNGSGPGTGYDPNGYGDYVYIEHPDGTTTLYGHLSAINVADGDTVSQGQNIGAVGNTGGSTGPHLHFEVSNAPFAPPLTINGQTWSDNAGVGKGSYVVVGTAFAATGLGGPGNVPTEEENPFVAGAILEENKDLLNRFTPDAKQWFARTVNFVEGRRNGGLDNETLTYGDITFKPKGPNLFTAFINIGWAFTFALFVYAIVNANYFYRSDDYWKILGRLIIAVALISGTPAISKSMGNNWAKINDFTQKSFAADVNTQLFNSTLSIVASLPSFLAGLAAMDKLAEVSDGGFSLSLPFSGGEEKGTTKARAAMVVRIALGVIITMYSLHTFTIYSTSLVLILAMLFLPIVASLLLLPSTASYITRWVSMVLTAYASLIVGIVVYSMAMDIAFVAPLDNLGTSIVDTGKSLIDTFSAVIPNINIFDPESLQTVTEYADGVATESKEVVANMTNTIGLFVFYAIFMIVGMLVGVFLLLNFERMVAGFFGGAAASGANALFGAAGLALGQLSSAGGSGGGGGGGGNSKPALPASPGGNRAGKAQISNTDGSARQTSTVRRGNFQKDPSVKTIDV